MHTNYINDENGNKKTKEKLSRAHKISWGDSNDKSDDNNKTPSTYQGSVVVDHSRWLSPSTGYLFHLNASS